MDGIELSILVATYNHEKYIVAAIDSILCQKVDFTYEILVGEDCSTDGTRMILQEYEKKYPEVFKIFYRNPNMGMAENTRDLLGRCKGDYISILEGDDFWTDENKLQIQRDFLKNNPEYSGIYHHCMEVNASGTMVQPKIWWYWNGKQYILQQCIDYRLPGQTSTVMFQNFFLKDEKYLRVLKEAKRCPGDRLLPLFCLLNGIIYCMDEVMGAYRVVLDESLGSWTSKNHRSKKYNYLQVCYETMEVERVAAELGCTISLEGYRAYSFGLCMASAIVFKEKQCLVMCKEIYKLSTHKIKFLWYGFISTLRGIKNRKKQLYRIAK